MRKNLFVGSKMDYVRGKRPKVNCIFCAIKAKNPQVKTLVIFESKFFFVSLNLHPYNPGHLIIFPKRHIKDIRELNLKEEKEIQKLTKVSLKILESIYFPSGFNIGYNLGTGGGASIQHLHLHIVPRYRNEVGFMEVISDTKIIVEFPKTSKEKLKKAFEKEKIKWKF